MNESKLQEEEEEEKRESTQIENWNSNEEKNEVKKSRLNELNKKKEW